MAKLLCFSKDLPNIAEVKLQKQINPRQIAYDSQAPENGVN